MKVDQFAYHSLEELLQDSKQKGYDFPVSENPAAVLSKPIAMEGVEFAGRIVAQPVEGFDASEDGSPGPRTLERYRYMVQHGIRIIWMESIAISEQGRSNPAQLWLTEENMHAFQQMLREIRSETDESVCVIAQLTHSGRYSSPKGRPEPVCAFSNPYIPKENEKIITDREVQEMEEDYVKTAILAEQAGFDAVDIRACHGYLLNEFFAAYNREGIYGGSFENRTRFYIDVLKKVKASLVKTKTATRLNLYDGVPWPYGWGVSPDRPEEQALEEPLRLVAKIYELGIRLINITNGIGAFSPYVIRPYDRGGKEPAEIQLAGVWRMLDCARLVKQTAPEAVIVASAFTWLREYGPDIAAGGIEQGWFDLAGFGRQTIAYPEMVEDLMGGGMKREKCCRTCCMCTKLIKEKGEHVRCVFRKDG